MRTCVLSRRTGFPKKKATTSEDLKEAAQSGGLEEVDAKRKEPEEPRRKAADPWGSRREGGELRDPTEPLRNLKNPRELKEAPKEERGGKLEKDLKGGAEVGDAPAPALALARSEHSLEEDSLRHRYDSQYQLTSK